MERTVIAPIIALLALAIQGFTGVAIAEETINQIVLGISNIATATIVIYGIFKNHKKKPAK